MKIKLRLDKFLKPGSKNKGFKSAAKYCGTSRDTIARMYHNETNNIKIDILEKLCEFCDCELSELLEQE